MQRDRPEPRGDQVPPAPLDLMVTLGVKDRLVRWALRVVLELKGPLEPQERLETQVQLAQQGQLVPKERLETQDLLALKEKLVQQARREPKVYKVGRT